MSTTKTQHLVDNVNVSQATFCGRDVTPTMDVTNRQRLFQLSGRACSQCCNVLDRLRREQQKQPCAPENR